MSSDFRHVYKWHRGGSLSLALKVKSGNVTGSETVSANGKAISHPNDAPPGDGAPVAFVCDVTFVAAVDDKPAYWHFTCADVVPKGFYLLDAHIPLAGPIPVQVRPIAIEVDERVTVPGS